jgi:LTXXQ motif family protein
VNRGMPAFGVRAMRSSSLSSNHRVSSFRGCRRRRLGDQPTAASAAELQRMQESQSVLIDAHLADMKAGLKLTEEQAKNWAAFESAVHDAAKGKADRWRQARELVERGERPSPSERMSTMADHLEKSGAELKAVVDAAKPVPLRT